MSYEEYLKYVQSVYMNGDEEPAAFNEWLKSKERE